MLSHLPSVRNVRRGISTLALCAVLGLSATAVSAPVSAAEEIPAVTGTSTVPGARIIGQQWLTARTLELTVDSPSFVAPVPVEVTLPNGYGEDASHDWPVTYFLIGTNGDQTMFRTRYDGEELSASYPSIVVSPRGDAGYWSDWHNNAAGGPPEYETFVTEQLMPLIDANFNTKADRAHRAVLGDSMGGYGALMLAARNPDLFAAASSLSGAVDTNWAPGTALVSLSPPLFDAAIPDSIYGPRLTNEVTWRGHNPVDLAANLRTIDLQVYTGNGILGAEEFSDPTGPANCTVEAGIIEPESRSLHNTLVGLGVPHKYAPYNWGCHTPVMFKQQITETLPRFAEVFARNTPEPPTFDYRSIEPTFELFDWTVAVDPNRATEFLDLRNVSDTGFTITGSGTTRITTPPIFRGKKTVIALVNGVPTSLKPDSTGQITLSVDLGPANQNQQYTFGAVTNLRTSVITFLR